MRIFITGSSGSFGRALIKRLVSDPLVEKICTLSRDEHKVRALADMYPEPNPLRWFVGDVRDIDRLRMAFQGVDVIVHAAALKRIDAVINESIELDRTNVTGTVNVLRAALECGVRKVIFISSDKSCHPTNAYGVSKAMAEHHAIGFNAYSVPRGMSVSVARWGNCFASTGSIYHIWKAALARGETLKLTHPSMTRFHIQLDDAVEFCMTSIRRMYGGEIYLPDMPSYRLVDLAEAMGGKTELIGLRQGGEKLQEQLVSDEETSRMLWQHDRYMVMPSVRTWSASPYAGEAVPVGTRLMSDDSARWLTVDDLKREVRRYESTSG